MKKLIDTIPKNKKLILFDGVCNLCNDAVLRVIKYDKKMFFYLQQYNQKLVKQLQKNWA